MSDIIVFERSARAAFKALKKAPEDRLDGLVRATALLVSTLLDSPLSVMHRFRAPTGRYAVLLSQSF
jgi:hypothetical protein